MEVPLGVQPGDTFLVEVAGADEAQQQAQMQMNQDDVVMASTDVHRVQVAVT